MDSIKIQKQQAMRNYKIKAQIFCVKIAVYSLAALISSLFYLCIFWFPTMKHFVSMYLPTIYSLFFSSKFLFILANLIVVILIGDSMLRSDNSVSPSTDEFYHEYIAKNRGLNHMKKQRPLSLMSSNDVSKAQDQVLRPLKTVKSCSMICHDVIDPKKSMASDQVLRPLKTVTSCNMTLHGVTDCKKSMASDQVMRPLKTVTSCNMASDQVLQPLKTVRSRSSCNLVLNGVSDPKKSSMAISKTQGQRKKPKSRVHEKKTTTTTHDQKDINSSIIVSSGGEVVEFVEKFNGMELQESTKKGSEGNRKEEEKEIEKIEVHHENEGGKCNGKEKEKEEEEEEINVYYHDHDSLQRDELNRKVEEFIARVNRRRLLEAGQGTVWMQPRCIYTVRSLRSMMRNCLQWSDDYIYIVKVVVLCDEAGYRRVYNPGLKTRKRLTKNR